MINLYNVTIILFAIGLIAFSSIEQVDAKPTNSTSPVYYDYSTSKIEEPKTESRDSQTENAKPEQWIKCAVENGDCIFDGTKEVKYGKDSTWVYRTFTNNVKCTTLLFGDPLYGIVKECYYYETQLPMPEPIPEPISEPKTMNETENIMQHYFDQNNDSGTVDGYLSSDDDDTWRRISAPPFDSINEKVNGSQSSINFSIQDDKGETVLNGKSINVSRSLNEFAQVEFVYLLTPEVYSDNSDIYIESFAKVQNAMFIEQNNSEGHVSINVKVTQNDRTIDNSGDEIPETALCDIVVYNEITEDFSPNNLVPDDKLDYKTIDILVHCSDLSPNLNYTITTTVEIAPSSIIGSMTTAQVKDIGMRLVQITHY